jgi:ribosomal-protein-alanine N-acetyltransferase
VIDPGAAVEIRFRRMRVEDVEAVYAIDVLCFALPWSARSYRYEVTDNPSSRSWVAEATDARGHTQVVGMIVLWIILDEAHVATLAAHPDFRRLKIGQNLLARGLIDAAEWGATKAYLEVRRGNLAAQDLYQKFGFTVTGERPRYYVDNQEDALLMTLDPLSADTLRPFFDETTAKRG